MSSAGIQLNRLPLDKWSKREQLCLASAVSCSGDQNWITVSRTLKACSNGSENRPADWYSQKNCAVQYGHLLESVETTKRKKRSSEGGPGVSSPATVEPPTELLLRRLTEERLQEIKAQMRRDQEEYLRVYREIEALQSDGLSEKELQEMWQQIESEQETQRIDEMKMENRMRDREQRKKEMASSWRNAGMVSGTRRTNSATDTTSVDMDVEEMPGANKTQQQTATSPLLTSLLKSPTAQAGGSSNSSSSTTATGGSVARATAPTITSLLTSGAGAIANQPAITLKTSSDSTFMTRPISGPPVAEVLTPTTPGTERSPSQAAPTLSMLLEKNKTAAKSAEGTSASQSTSAEASNPEQQSSATAEVEAAKKESKPATESAAAAATEDSDEQDPIDEQQLLEVLTSIDDIMEMEDIEDIVIDEDILKDVENETNSPETKMDVFEDFEDKLDALKREQNSKKSSNSPSVAANVTKPIEVVIGSSDDSNDNIPLATVASQESKERSHSTTESSPPEAGDGESMATAPNSERTAEEVTETVTLITSSSEDNGDEESVQIKESEEEESGKEKREEDTLIEDQEEVTKDKDTENPSLQEESSTVEKVKDEETQSTDKSKSTGKSKPVPLIISINDTDEESSSSSKAKPPTKKSEEAKTDHETGTGSGSSGPGGATPTPQPPPAGFSGVFGSAPTRPPLLRKLPHRDRSESPMIDDDTATASDHSTTRASSRRRCSSTPLIDSIPNSPASSEHTDDRRETRGASKKIFLSIYAALSESRHAGPFRRAFHEEHKHAEICLRPMDLPTIKRNIDSGVIRSISELQRDVLLMCQNLLLLYKPQTAQHKAARLFQQECHAIKEFASHHQEGPATPAGGGKADKEKPSQKARSGSRKSQRHH